jgi:hypothetical protein
MFTVSFPKLFEPEERNGELWYSAELIFDADTDLSALKAAAQFAANEKWPNGAPQPFHSPFKDGSLYNAQRVASGKAAVPIYEGKTFLRVKTKEAPSVVDELVEEIPAINAKKIYPGSKGYAQLGASGWGPIEGKSGVTFYLNMYQFAEDGERLDSRSDAKDVFSKLPVRNAQPEGSPAANGNANPNFGGGNDSGGLFD